MSQGEGRRIAAESRKSPGKDKLKSGRHLSGQGRYFSSIRPKPVHRSIEPCSSISAPVGFNHAPPNVELRDLPPSHSPNLGVTGGPLPATLPASPSQSQLCRPRINSALDEHLFAPKDEPSSNSR